MADTQVVPASRNDELGRNVLLLIWIVGFALGCLIGTSGVAIYAHFSPNPPDDAAAAAQARKAADVCYAPSCVATTELLQDNLNPLVAPCHNFQEYVCSRYLGPELSLMRTEFNAAEERMADRVRALNQSALGAPRKAADLLKKCEDRNQLDITAEMSHPTLLDFMGKMGLYLTPSAYQTALFTPDRHLTMHVGLAFTYALSGLFTVRPTVSRTIRVTADLLFSRAGYEHLTDLGYFKALVVAYTEKEHGDLAKEGRKLYKRVTSLVATATRLKDVSPFSLMKVRDVAFDGVSADAFALAIEEKTPYSSNDNVELDPMVPVIVNSIWQQLSLVDLYLWTSWHVLAQCALHTSSHVASRVDDKAYSLECFRKVSLVLGPPVAAVQLFAKARAQELVSSMVRNVAYCLTKNTSRWVREFEANPIVVGPALSVRMENVSDAYFESIPAGNETSFLGDWLRLAAVRSRKISPQDAHVDLFQEGVSVYPDGNVVVPALFLNSRLYAADGPYSVYYGGLGHMVARSMVQRFARPDAPTVLPCAADQALSKAPDFRENLLAYWCVRLAFDWATKGSTVKRLPMLGVLDPAPKLLLTMGCLKDCAVRRGMTSSSCRVMERHLNTFTKAFSCSPGQDQCVMR